MYRMFPSLEPLFPAGYTLIGNDEGRLLSLLAVLTSSSEQMCQKRLHAARASGSLAVKHVLRPLRTVLTSLHPKLQHVGLRVVAVQARGYVLDGLTENEHGAQVP